MARYGHYKFSATADPNTGKMKISLVIEGKQGTAFEIDTKKSAAAAGIILGAARKAGTQQPRTKNGPVEFTSVPCSGCNIGYGKTRQTVTLLFHFGETTLGIPLPLANALSFAQHRMTAAAAGPRQ